MKLASVKSLPSEPKPEVAADVIPPVMTDPQKGQKKRRTAFKALYILLAIIALSCGILHFTQPQLKVSLLKLNNPAIHVYADADVANGTSRAYWINREKVQYECDIDYGIEFPFCGLVVKFKQETTEKNEIDDTYTFAQAQPIDLSIYVQLFIYLDYEGPSESLNLFLRNGPVPASFEMYDRVFYANASFSPKAKVAVVELDKMRPVSWWVDRYNPPQEQLDAPLNQVLDLGIDLPSRPKKGIHRFQIKDLVAVKPLFPPNVLNYAGLISLALLVLTAAIQLLMHFALSRYKDENLALQSKVSEDPLTLCLNRYGLESIVNHMFPLNNNVKMYVVVLDLDHFKRINDTYGHTMGDEVLRETAGSISKQLRQEDILGRWGGEEFVMITRISENLHIQPLLERLMESVRKLQFGSGTQTFSISMSVGATAVEKSESFGEAFIRADKAMYDAKNGGRNQFIVL